MVSIVSSASERGYDSVVSGLASYLPSGQTVKKMFLGYLALSGAGVSAARLINRPAIDMSVMRLPVSANDGTNINIPVDMAYLKALSERYGETYDYQLPMEASEYVSDENGVERRALAEDNVRDITIGSSVNQKVSDQTQFRFMLDKVTPIRLSSGMKNLTKPWPFALSLSRFSTSPDTMLFSEAAKGNIERLSSVFFPGEYFINFGKSQDNRTGDEGSIFFEAKEIDKRDAYAEAGAVSVRQWAPALEINDAVYGQILPKAIGNGSDEKYGTACFRVNVCGSDRLLNVTLYGEPRDLNNTIVDARNGAAYKQSYSSITPNSTKRADIHEFLMDEGKIPICVANTLHNREIDISLGAFGIINELDSCPVPNFNPVSPPASTVDLAPPPSTVDLAPPPSTIDLAPPPANFIQKDLDKNKTSFLETLKKIGAIGGGGVAATISLAGIAYVIRQCCAKLKSEVSERVDEQSLNSADPSPVMNSSDDRSDFNNRPKFGGVGGPALA